MYRYLLLKYAIVSVKVKISARLARSIRPLSLAPIRDFAFLRSGTAVRYNYSCYIAVDIISKLEKISCEVAMHVTPGADGNT